MWSRLVFVCLPALCAAAWASGCANAAKQAHLRAVRRLADLQTAATERNARAERELMAVTSELERVDMIRDSTAAILLAGGDTDALPPPTVPGDFDNMAAFRDHLLAREAGLKAEIDHANEMRSLARRRLAMMRADAEHDRNIMRRLRGR